jgi:hypothetical protein
MLIGISGRPAGYLPEIAVDALLERKHHRQSMLFARGMESRAKSEILRAHRPIYFATQQMLKRRDVPG